MLFVRFLFLLASFFSISLIASFASDTGFEQRLVTPYVKQIGNYRGEQNDPRYETITSEEVDNFLKNQYLSDAANSDTKKDTIIKIDQKLDESAINTPPPTLGSDNDDGILSKILRHESSKWFGDYRSVRLFVGLPMSKINFEASETRAISNTAQENFNLFSGLANISTSPGFSFAIGYSFQKYYSFEVELQYLMLNSKVDSVNNFSANNNFSIGSGIASFNIFSLFINNHLRIDFFDGKLETFIGCGIGLGYAIPKNKYFIDSAIVFPELMIEAGMQFGIAERMKMVLFWRAQFMNFKATNKQPFTDTTGNLINNRPISDGNILFKNILMNSIGIEIKFF